MKTSDILAILTMVTAAGFFLMTPRQRGGSHTKTHRKSGKKTRRNH